jgi:hypothetical protein
MYMFVCVCVRICVGPCSKMFTHGHSGVGAKPGPLSSTRQQTLGGDKNVYLPPVKSGPVSISILPQPVFAQRALHFCPSTSNGRVIGCLLIQSNCEWRSRIEVVLS